jgi:hypothetical protein
MRTQTHRIVDTDPKRGNVVDRLTDPPRRARRAAISDPPVPPSPRKVPVMIEAHELTKALRRRESGTLAAMASKAVV